MVVWLRSVRKFRYCSRNELPNKQAWTRVNSGARSGTVTRILTAAILIPAVAAMVWWGPTWLVAAGAGGVALLALREFFLLGARLNLRAYQLCTYICAIGIFFQQWAASAVETSVIRRGVFLTDVSITERTSAVYHLPLELVLFIFMLGCAATVFASSRPLVDALGDIGISTSGLVFIALPLSAVVRIHGVGILGPKLLLFTLVLVWVGDTTAYFVGRSFGRVPMAAQLSPRKTWEGAAANLLGSAIVALVLFRWLDIDAFQAVLMACLANIAGQAGDLLKSAYKRGAGVKDSGHLLPGHGGALDRIDALILAAPVVWYYFRLVLASRF
jgi:phosphatidate cytidylyltransferase